MDACRRPFPTVLLALLVLLTALAGCQRQPPPDSDAEDPSWSHFVSGRTDGVISRADPIRVRFMNDVVPEQEVGQPVADRVELSPDAEVEVVFTSRRELVITPREWLESGRHYTVVINTEGLAGFPGDRDEYRFTVQVMPQALELRLDGVIVEPGAEGQALVAGWLNTADRADNAEVEKTLRATVRDLVPQIRWEHGDGGREHRFVVGPVARVGQGSMLTLAWDGKPLGVDDAGTREVLIPPLGEFLVTGADVVLGTEEFIAVDFSLPLDAGQDLTGLVSLSSGAVTTRIAGSRLKVYPRERPEGEVTLTLHAGIRAGDGKKLKEDKPVRLAFEALSPAVEFIGSGVILPDADRLLIPFTAVNVNAVQVTALRVYDDNVGQFLQVNELGGQAELKRVGRYLWKKTVALAPPPGNRRGRYAIDVTDLLGEHPGEIYQVTLSFDRRHVAVKCGDDEPLPAVDDSVQNGDEDDSVQQSGWDYAEDWYGESMDWAEREDPCKPAYYAYSGKTKASRNFLASNIGLVAKRGSDARTHVIATDIRAGAPLSGVEITLFNFQGQPVGKGSTDSRGFAEIASDIVPFYLEARQGEERGYLKLAGGSALSTSHFDTGGEQVKRGVKGALYGERGVWRPGDDIHLVLALHDPQDRVPDTHPATLELIDPQGKTVATVTSAQPVGPFYTFRTATAEDAPTGTWRAKAHVGGLDFEKTLKIETVMPNRLKLTLDTGAGVLVAGRELRATLDSQWLHGAPAANLRADVKAKLVPQRTAFTRFADYTFDDPAREYTSEDVDLFEGQLDAAGHVAFGARLDAGGEAPGLLRALLTTRVFEPGGAFSVGYSEATLSPYEAYVGIRLPAGDRARNMLLTDTAHPVEIATVDTAGAPVAVRQLEVSVFKVEWRWWWDKSGDSLARYASGDTSTLVSREKIAGGRDGRAQATFTIKYPDWGRYLVRVCDLQGGHCAGRTVYVDWPGWAGRGQEQRGPGASALTLWSDKAVHTVGETAVVHLPPMSKGRALLSLESGSRVISMQWLEAGGDKDPVFRIPVTADMTPNVYVHVTLLQPHAGKDNDRPLRLYGVLPLVVDDPQTKLAPVVQAPEVIRPETATTISVREAQGRAMTYTLAVVDEGLLGLTNFRTPDLRTQFYQREALGVRTWDLFDEVVGGYGGALERILALGGSDGLARNDAGRQQRRFPPVVQFLGAFRLKAGETRSHELKLPPYVGAVRVMAVAGEGGAWGAGEKTVTVRAPLMVQATVPRVLGPGEAFTVPVSVWALEDSVRNVQLSVEIDDLLVADGPLKTALQFTRTGDQLGLLALRAKQRLGKTKLRFVATSGREKAEETLWVEIRAPNPPTTVVKSLALKPGEKQTLALAAHGMAGTQSAALEVSSVPPLNLGRRLDELIGYPHGCVEQTTSRAFPQIYLPQLQVLDEKRAAEVQANVRTAIARLREFQRRDGAFSYWPWGGWAGEPEGRVRDWSSSYVGHFLLEAQRAGYQVPLGMLQSWQKWQRSQAQRWTAGDEESRLDQAYRLYTLALAGDADIGAMNRLREQVGERSAARWLLAAGYQQAGMPDAARALVAGAQEPEYADYRADSYTYGSALRDRALVLLVRQALGNEDAARQSAEAVSAALASDAWLSTQSTSWSLVALAQFGARHGKAGAGGLKLAGAGVPARQVTLAKALARETLPAAVAGNLQLENTTGGTLYASVVQRGVPPPGEETAAASGLQLDVQFTDAAGQPVDPARVPQGTDLRAVVSVRNVNEYRVENIALTAVAPSGWEIRGGRLTAEAAQAADVDYRDTRDDRVLLYFPLAPRQQKTFTLEFNAAYLGRYYLPAWSVAAMYDARLSANTAGRTVEVVPAGR